MKINIRSFSIVLYLFLLGCISSHPNNQYLILEGGKYFDGKAFKSFAEIQIKDGKIIAITDKKSDLEGQRISVVNKFIIPGLIDSHVHFAGCPSYPYVPTNALLNANSALRCGTTTCIDLFYPETGVKAFKDSINPYSAKYCSALMAGPILTAPGGHGTEYGVPTRTISSVKEAEEITSEVAAKKEIDIIKIVYQGYTSKHTLTKEMVKKIVDVAHKYHKKVVAHIFTAKEAMDCIEAGVDGLAHMPYDLMSEDDLNRLKKSGAIVIPTITVYQICTESLPASYMSDSLLWQTAQPAYMENFKRAALPTFSTKILDSIGKSFLEENLKNCVKMQIPILAGTDAGNYAVFYGYSLHYEIAQYVKNGMTPSEALCSATKNIQLLFPNIHIGEIAPGYIADIVVLNANPVEDIQNTKQIDFVLHKGFLAQKNSPTTSIIH